MVSLYTPTQKYPIINEGLILLKAQAQKLASSLPISPFWQESTALDAQAGYPNSIPEIIEAAQPLFILYKAVSGAVITER